MFLSPYINGQLAYQAGKKIDENPNPAGTTNADDWNDGWFDARDEAAIEQIHDLIPY